MVLKSSQYRVSYTNTMHKNVYLNKTHTNCILTVNRSSCLVLNDSDLMGVGALDSEFDGVYLLPAQLQWDCTVGDRLNILIIFCYRQYIVFLHIGSIGDVRHSVRSSLEYLPCNKWSRFGSQERSECDHNVFVMNGASPLRSEFANCICTVSVPCSSGLHSRSSSMCGNSRESKSIKVSGYRPRLFFILTLSIGA